jgi:hypothetical protein
MAVSRSEGGGFFAKRHRLCVSLLIFEFLKNDKERAISGTDPKFCCTKPGLVFNNKMYKL